MAKKSYWQVMSLNSEAAKQTCKAWFEPLSDGMTPYKAEVLCDVETDREKKLRAFMVDADGVKFQFERTRGRNFSISSKRLDAAEQRSATGSPDSGNTPTADGATNER